MVQDLDRLPLALLLLTDSVSLVLLTARLVPPVLIAQNVWLDFISMLRPRLAKLVLLVLPTNSKALPVSVPPPVPLTELVLPALLTALPVPVLLLARLARPDSPELPVLMFVLLL